MYHDALYLDVITSFAFIVESVYSVDTGTFVISTKKEKIFWVSEELVMSGDRSFIEFT